MIGRGFPRRRPKGKAFTNMVKHDIRTMALSIKSDLKRLENEYAKMINAVEFSIYEKLVGVAFKARALEQFILDSKIPSDEMIAITDTSSVRISRICVNALREVVSFAWELPMNYTEAVANIVADESPVHWSKINKYMPIDKPRNLLDDLYYKLSSAPMYFREEVCQSCGWSLNTFFGRKANRIRLRKRRVLDQPLTDAEAEKIISIFKEGIIPALLNTCETWEQNLNARRKEITLK
ncbi:hypothetical protein SAMN04488121_101233 [Chitinophaga filiformis]|uniref:Uncharacterized protein n=2 Tax=Chitinophaga filiformis TaxID=104663 RepID=A0A1G7GZH4_CHIFI|nr:hypothetical protein SAMN04488121_101233 [Chitinophaga filiformis]